MKEKIHVVILTSDSAFKNYTNPERGRSAATNFAAILKRHAPYKRFFVVEKEPGACIVCREYNPVMEDMDIPHVETAVLDLETFVLTPLKKVEECT